MKAKTSIIWTASSSFVLSVSTWNCTSSNTSLRPNAKSPPSQQSPLNSTTTSQKSSFGDGSEAKSPNVTVSSEQAPSEFPGSHVFYDAARKPGPSIVLLHGSEGGVEGLSMAAKDAEFLVKSGFNVMFLCWFGCPGRPDKILHIPIESVIDATNWFKQSKYVNGSSTGIFGFSRGAELSLLVGTMTSSVQPVSAIAIHAGSDTIVPSYDPENPMNSPTELNPSTGRQSLAAAWTWNQQLVFGEADDDSGPGPRIQIERYPGPLFVSHGEVDEVWSVDRGRSIEKSRSLVPGLYTEPHYWPGEGHVLQKSNNTMLMKVAAFFGKQFGITPNIPPQSASSTNNVADDKGGSSNLLGSCHGLYNGTLETCEEIFGSGPIQCPDSQDYQYQAREDQCPRHNLRETCSQKISSDQSGHSFRQYIYSQAPAEVRCE